MSTEQRHAANHHSAQELDSRQLCQPAELEDNSNDESLRDNSGVNANTMDLNMRSDTTEEIVRVSAGDSNADTETMEQTTAKQWEV